MITTIKNSITKPRILTAALIITYLAATNFFFGYVSPSMILVGLPCPACGFTRAGFLFFTGSLAESFRMHPLFIPTLALAAGAVICKLFWPNRFEVIKILTIVLIISSFIVFIIRMAVLFPHSPPMNINRNSLLHNLI